MTPCDGTDTGEAVARATARAAAAVGEAHALARMIHEERRRRFEPHTDPHILVTEQASRDLGRALGAIDVAIGSAMRLKGLS